jgi:hypothetical protein
MILIYSTQDVRNAIETHVEAICPLEITNIKPPKGLFKIEHDTKGSIVLSFIYYYIMTYVKVFVYAIFLFGYLFIMYIVIGSQYSYTVLCKEIAQAKVLKLTDRTFEIPEDEREFKWNSVLSIFDLIFRWLPEKIGDLVWVPFNLIAWGALFHPHNEIKFFNFKNMIDIKVHSFIFITGLVLSLVYAYTFIDKSPNLCKHLQDKEKHFAAQAKFKKDFQQGQFIIMFVVIVSYFVFFIRHFMNQ